MYEQFGEIGLHHINQDIQVAPRQNHRYFLLADRVPKRL
jgi:hypothetical protein